MTDIEERTFLDEPELIGACCLCDQIRIDIDLFIKSESIWFGKSENPQLYNEFTKGKMFTHGYCPEHYKRAMEEVRKYCEEKFKEKK
jgi:hypothetical protein